MAITLGVNMTLIIGREQESQLLNDIWNADQAALIAIYGRRRVGKTHLVRELFSKEKNYIEITGSKDGSLADQLHNFIDGFAECFAPGLELTPPASWRKAFSMLTKKFKEISPDEKITLFLDELPWLATPKSRLLQNLDYFWNRHWSKLKNLRVIVCGSAASWMLDKLINAKGGLYNRVTQTLLLQPFMLGQVEQFLHYLKIKYTRKQILDLYMVTGGIPFYLNQIKRSKSVVQNINDLCFREDGLLYSEFLRLFASLFKESDHHFEIIKALAEKPQGMSSKDISKKVKLTFGGRFSKKLSELEATGFIKRFVPLGKQQRDSYYQLIDEYSMFYLQWIHPFVLRNESPPESNYWHLQIDTPTWNSWAGSAFEKICFKHANQIKKALGLTGISAKMGSWQIRSNKGENKSGAQIDLILDRDDGVITLMDAKYSQKPYSLDKATALNIANKITVFEVNFPTNKQITMALITTVGFKKTIWSEDLINQIILLNDLYS